MSRDEFRARLESLGTDKTRGKRGERRVPWWLHFLAMVSGILAFQYWFRTTFGHGPEIVENAVTGGVIGTLTYAMLEAIAWLFRGRR